MDETKARYAQNTDKRTLGEALVGADIFLGLSAAGVVKQEMVVTMADKPMVFALANPTPEIMPELVKAVRPDAIIADSPQLVLMAGRTFRHLCLDWMDSCLTTEAACARPQRATTSR